MKGILLITSQLDKWDEWKAGMGTRKEKSPNIVRQKKNSEGNCDAYYL